MNFSDAIADLDAKHGIFIDGRGHGTDATFQVHDPATREVIAEISDGTASEATSAVDAAARALDTWAATPPRAGRHSPTRLRSDDRCHRTLRCVDLRRER
jgi:succinate-semialdehyde dehydrogenase/glutarate-semialdehyde dehydrogenase